MITGHPESHGHNSGSLVRKGLCAGKKLVSRGLFLAGSRATAGETYSLPVQVGMGRLYSASIGVVSLAGVLMLARGRVAPAQPSPLFGEPIPPSRRL